MKYIIPENKLDKVVFKYLNNTLKSLEKRKPMYYKGIVFAHPNEEYGILGYENDGDLYIYYKLIDEISSGFGLDESDSKSIIGRWASDRLQLEVINTFLDAKPSKNLASDRLQLEVINTDCTNIFPVCGVSDRLQLEVINTFSFPGEKRFLASDRL